MDSILAVATSACIGEVEIEKPEDFDDAAEKLWESQGFDAPTQCHQCKAELGDWEVDESQTKYFFENKKDKHYDKRN